VKKLFFLLLFVKAFAYIDLGTYGQTYEISEPDILAQIKKAYKDFNKTKIIEDYKEAYKRYMKVDFNLPMCKANTNTLFDPTITLTHDIYMPKYNIYIKKGQKFNPLKYASLNKYLMFIDATNKAQIALAKKYKDKAFIIVVKGDLDKVMKEIGIRVYKADKILLKAFKVKCLPTIFIQRGDKYQKIEFLLKVRNEN